MECNQDGTARLRSFRRGDLQTASAVTREQLLDVCMNEGFFYLEVGDDGGTLGEAMRYLMDFSRRLFDVDEEMKQRYPFQKTGRGRCSGYGYGKKLSA